MNANHAYLAAMLHGGLTLLLCCPLQAAGPPADQPARDSARPRARQIGIEIGILPPGPEDAITDVAGVLVGHHTLRSAAGVRTGVTAVVPHGGNLFQQKVPAAIVVGNGFGKLVGISQVDELGTLETPIVLTNTLSVFTAADAVIDYTLSQEGNQEVRSVNPVVGETNDGYLNDIRARRVRREHVLSAIRAARGGPVSEGSVGAGTGTRCLGFKGGIGTASRRVPGPAGGYTVGALVQSNFSGVLSVAGVPVGKELGNHFLKDLAGPGQVDGGSCMIVLATDAPLDARQLKRLARRALLGLGAVGSPMAHGSGDYVIAFSTHEKVRVSHGGRPRAQSRYVVPDEALSPLFQAAREATEEAVLNSLLRATTVTGNRGRKVEAIPIDRLLEICRRYGVAGRRSD
ncbi:MAG: DmpA family aminopeptidase [Planctomycetota bacterium]|jgi:D-aminopeptidase